MDSIKKFVKKHKKLVIILSLAIIAIILGIILYNYLFSMNGDNYGKRLDGINKVQISETDAKKLETTLQGIEGIKKATYDLKGRLINIVLDVNKGVAKDTAKGYSANVLEFFGDEEEAYYDIQVMVNCSECDATDETYPIIGYKNNSSSKFVWSNN